LGEIIMRILVIGAFSIALAGCGNSQAMKTIGTLAGSSAGSAVGQAINASGPWGYVAGIATTAVGGFAGNMVTNLFLPDTGKAVKSALIQSLDEPQTGKTIIWGTEKSPQMGIVATTGAPFASAAGATCRAFRITTGMPPAEQAAAAAPSTMDKVAETTAKVEGAAATAEKLSSVGGDATKPVSDAAGTVGDATKGIGQATAIMGGFGGDNKKVTEAFGTACKDAKGTWVTVKA
jgi:surface antigen